MMNKYYKFEINMKLLNILAIVIFILVYIIAMIINPNVLNIINEDYNFVYVYLGMFGYFFAHELLHGIGYSLFVKNKKNIKYGIKLEQGVFYAMCQEEISKLGIIISLLMPTIFLTFFSLPIGIVFDLPIIILYAIINLIGAVGDIVLLLLVIKLPKNIKYIDYDNTIGAYFLSDTDLSNIKSFGISCTQTGEHNLELIDSNHKLIYISKPSIIILVAIFFFLLLFLIF